jgi:hypothetical protein
MDFANQSLWELAFTTNKIAEKLTGSINSYIPIPEFSIPVSGRIFVVKVLSNSAKPHWAYACLLLQNLKVGIDLEPQIAINQAKKVFFKRANLLKFTEKVESLTCKIPYYLEDLNIIIYQYLGTDDESIFDLLKIIDKKVTDLSDFGN